MSFTPVEARAWAESTRPRDQYGRCAGLTDEFVAHFTGGSRRWYDSATDARNASGWLNPDPTVCPAGGIHFWSFTGKAWDGSVGDWGHVAPDIYGGGGGIFSATRYAREEWAVNAGITSVAAQSSRAGMRYLGWSRTYGSALPLTPDAGSAAADGSRPFTPQEEDMPLTNADLQAILTARFDVPGVGNVMVLEALGAAFAASPRNVWGYTFQHPIAVGPDGQPLQVSAGDFLRFEPAEHANTRAMVAKVAAGDVDYEKIAAEIAAQYPALDPHAFALAAADEADRRARERLGNAQ